MLHYVRFWTAAAFLSDKDVTLGGMTTHCEYSSVTSRIFGKLCSGKITTHLQTYLLFMWFAKVVPKLLPNRNRSRRPLFNNDTLRCTFDWKFLFDIDGGYQSFPIEIAATSQRPERTDIVIYSLSLHTVLLIKVARDSFGSNKMCHFFCQNLLFMAQAVRKWNNIRGSPCSIFQKMGPDIAIFDLLRMEWMMEWKDGVNGKTVTCLPLGSNFDNF